MTSNIRQGSAFTWRWVLLAWLACCSPAAQARIQYRNLLRNWLRQGMARTVVEVYQIAIDLPTNPNCLVTYFNMPAWTTATISVRMDTVNQSVATQQCIANSLSWRSVIAGCDDIPPSLQSTVGFRGRLEPYWTAQVLTAPGSGLVPSPPPPPPPPAFTVGDYSGSEDYSAPGPDPLAGPLGFGARTSAVIRCMSMYVPAMTLDNETQTEIVQSILAYNLTQILPSQYVQAFGSQDPKKALIACIRNITASSGPQAPSPPPGPAVPGPGKVQRFIQTIRDFLGLQPFAAAPVTVSNDNPYEGWEGQAQMRDLTADNDGAYQVPSNACQKAFASPAFKGNTMSADVGSPVIVSAKNATYDSCYLTQAHVYINWDPSSCQSTAFNTTANLTVTATYKVYPYCNSNWILSMGKVMEFVILVLGIPVLLLILLLGLPTAWRIAYWPFRYAYLRITQKSKWMMVLKHRFRMQAGTDKSWKWWQVVARFPPMTKFLAMRKYFLYACLTIEMPDGYSRALQVFIIALCTVSVTIMVWRPSTKLVLGVNPSRIALQLQDFDSDGHTVRALVRYFEIVGISIGLGCLAYLSSLANINKPGNKYWTLHRILSGSCLVYLCAIVALQMINVGAYLISMHNMEAYTWIVAVQSVNIMGALALQLAVVLQRKAPPPKAAGCGKQSSADGEAELELQTTSNVPPSHTAPNTRDHEQTNSPATWDNNPTWDRGSGNSQRDSPTRPGSMSRHGSMPGPGASPSPALTPRQAAVAMRSWPSQARGSMLQLPHSRVEDLQSGRGRIKFSSTKSFAKAKGPSALPMLWHKFKLAFSDWILEETQFYTDANTGAIITVRLLRYPSWFLASVLVAFYMLIFHFIKSLIWARDLGECVVTPQACVFPFIQTWATTFSWQQLAIFQTAGNEILENISYLQETNPSGAELLDAILQAETANGLVYWTNVVNSAVIFFTPGNSKIAQWMDAVGNRMILVSTAGFTLGAALGCITLTMALASYKVIIKKHRILKILQQLQHSSLKCKGLDGAASLPAPAVASVLAKVQQAALAGTATVHEMAATASTSHLSFLIPDKPRTSDPGSPARPSTTTTHPLPVPSQPVPVAHALDTIDSVSTIPPDNTIGTLTKPNSAIRRSQFRQHHIIAVVNEAKDDASEDDRKEHKDEKEPERDIVDVTSIAAVRALTAPIGFVVFFIGVLLSATIVQLYVVGVILTAALAVITTQWFWVNIAAVYYPYLLAIIIIIILNKVILIMWIGESYVSDGDKILRPAGWFAFMIIASITNLILGLFLAIIRLVSLLLTTIFTIGMLDRSILSVRSMMDVPYKSFLAGIHLQNSLTNLNDPGLRPGPRGRAIRRWRAAKNAVVSLGADRWEELVIRNRAMGRDGSDCESWTQKDTDGKIASNGDMPPPVGV